MGLIDFGASQISTLTFNIYPCLQGHASHSNIVFSYKSIDNRTLVDGTSSQIPAVVPCHLHWVQGYMKCCTFSSTSCDLCTFKVWIIWKNGYFRNSVNLHYKNTAASFLFSLYKRTNGKCINSHTPSTSLSGILLFFRTQYS